MKTIIIGREGNQPFLINDEFVSRQHALFTYDESTGRMTITDRSRPGVGTFVRMGNQFQQVTHCNVDPTTDVRLGPYFTFRIGQLFQPVNTGGGENRDKKKPQNADIAYLRNVAENYETTKMKLEEKQANINSVRGLSLVASIAGGGITALLPTMLSDGGQPVEWYYYLLGPLVAVLLLGGLMLYCNRASKKIIAEKNRNDKTYKISFCCPACHVPFAGKLYENILAESKCPKCKTEFYDSKI